MNETQILLLQIMATSFISGAFCSLLNPTYAVSVAQNLLARITRVGFDISVLVLIFSSLGFVWTF